MIPYMEKRPEPYPGLLGGSEDTIELSEVVHSPPPKLYRDPIVLYSVSLLIVAALSFYGGWRTEIDRKNVSAAQAWQGIGRACVEYVNSLKPRKVTTVNPIAPVRIAQHCEQIADRAMERINGMRTGMIR